MIRNTKHKLAPLTARNALVQVKISVLLLAIIPSLSLFYLGTVAAENNRYFSPGTLLLIALLTALVAVPGFVILKKYPKNIMRLRRYITDISQGTLPDKIELEDAQSSDDLKYIETHFNHVLENMRQRIVKAEKQFKTEQTLRKTVEKQQEDLLEAERQRVMIQTLGAACHHIGQPATVLQIQMDLLLSHVTDDKEKEQLNECAKEVSKISEVLQQLQRTSSFRSVPYIDDKNSLDERILAINKERE